MSRSFRLSLALVASALAFAPVANAIDVTVSGHVDRFLRAADNGGKQNPEAGSSFQFLDNGSHQSRVRLTGREDLDGGSSSSGTGAGGPFAVGFDTELRIGDTSECYDVKNQVAEVSLPLYATGLTQSTCTDAVEWARADIFIDSKYGKASLGKGDSASRGTSRADLSGTDYIANYDNRRNQQIEFQIKGTPTMDSTIEYGEAFRWYEGARSQNRLRYDTPVWSGFQASLSTGTGGSESVVILDGPYAKEKVAFGATYAYGSDNDPTQVRLALGYTKWDVNRPSPGPAPPDVIEDATTISGSVLFRGGWNLTGMYGTTGAAGPGSTISEQSNWMIKGGYIWGKTALSISYTNASDILGTVPPMPKQDGKAYAFAFQTECTDWWTVYGAIEVAQLDNFVPLVGTPDSFEDIVVGTVGTSISF